MGVKKLNRLKKFMQVEVDLKRMETKFGGRDFFGFGDIAPFRLPSKRPKFPFTLYLSSSLSLTPSLPLLLLDYINVSIKVNTYCTAPVLTTIN